MSNSKTMMLECLAAQLSRVRSITRLVDTCLARNQEPQEWFNALANKLHELANYISRLRAATHVAEWPHPTGKGISQDNWVQQLNSTVSEIKDVLDEFAYLGSEINNIRVARVCGGSVNVVGKDEPIVKLKCLLRKLDGIEKRSEEKLLGLESLDVAEEADDQIEFLRDEPKILPMAGVREDETHPVTVDKWPQKVEGERDRRILNYPWSDYCRIQSFLRDARVLRQVYRNWIERNLQLQMVETSTHISTDGDEYLHKATEVVLQWDPFDLNDSGTVMTYFNELRRINSLLRQNVSKDLRYRAKSILHAATSRLESIISCLLNANAALYNLDKLFESSRQQSHWFCSSTSVSSSHIPYQEQDDASGSHYYNSSTSHACASEPSGSTSIRLQIMASNEIEEESDELTLQRFLHMISQITSLVGYSNPNYNGLPELRKIFRTVFAQFLENTVQSNGFQEVYDFQMQPKVDFMEMKLPELRERRNKWERTFKVVVLVLLPWQKCLCDIFFSHIPEYTYKCFYQVAEICVNKLLDFASAAVYAMPRNNERVFHLLYVYEVVDSLSSNISMVFSDAKQSFIPKRVTDTLSVLKNQILVVLNDFLKQLHDDTYCHNSSFGKIESTSIDVDVHKVTRYVMLYLKNLSIYRKIIDSSILSMEMMNSSERKYTISTFGQQVLTLVTCLKSNLKKKSSLLKNSNAQHVFWINNLNHIVQEANGHNLRNLLAREWVQEQHANIDWHLINYTESISAKALSCLDLSNGGNWITLPSENSIKHGMKSFKLAIEEICNIQASWKVPDPILRAKLRDTVSERVVLAYTIFLEMNRHKLQSKVIMKNSVYTTEDLKLSLQGIFEGPDY